MEMLNEWKSGFLWTWWDMFNFTLKSSIILIVNCSVGKSNLGLWNKLNGDFLAFFSVEILKTQETEVSFCSPFESHWCLQEIKVIKFKEV